MIDNLSTAGGAERVAAQIAANLDPERFESYLCSTRAADPMLRKELADAGVHVLALHRRRRIDLRPWQRLLTVLRTERIDILHAHKFGSNVWGTLLGRAARVPVVIAHEHTWSFEGQAVRKALDRHLIGRFADSVVAVSDLDRSRMLDIERLPEQKVITLHNGIPPLAPAQTNVRVELGIPADAPTVGTVAVLRPQKALSVLIEGAALLHEEFPTLRVLVAGREFGSEHAILSKLIAERGLNGTVHLLGHRADVPDVLAALDVAALTSDFEGAPLSVLEYMAAGKPIVATDVGGVPAMVDEGRGGLLVPRRDPAALASALAVLLRDRPLRERMGEYNRQRQQRDFDSETSVRRVEELYVDLFSRTARARREGWGPQPTSAAARNA